MRSAPFHHDRNVESVALLVVVEGLNQSDEDLPAVTSK